LHFSSGPVQAVSQHTPWAQNPELHCEGSVQLVPFDCTQIRPSQLLASPKYVPPVSAQPAAVSSKQPAPGNPVLLGQHAPVTSVEHSFGSPLQRIWPPEHVGSPSQTEQDAAGIPPMTMQTPQSVSKSPHWTLPPPKSHAQQLHADARCGTASMSIAINPIAATSVVRPTILASHRPSIARCRTAGTWRVVSQGREQRQWS
jgi:hypothetical protein